MYFVSIEFRDLICAGLKFSLKHGVCVFLPPTSEKLEGHIALGLSLGGCVCLSVSHFF